MNIPLVSILINNYNYGRFLADAIDSGLNQTYKNIEIIVVDDGSTDISRDIIAEYGDRITPLLKDNGGQASAFNAGFEMSKGDIICFLDSDDLFESEKVDKIVRTLADNLDAGWVFHDLAYIDAEGNESEYREHNKNKLVCSGALLDLTTTIQQGKDINYGPPATTALSLRRCLLHKIFPLPAELRITADECIKVPAMCLSKGIHLAEPLAKQRIHYQNAYTARKDNILQRLEIKIRTASFLRERFVSATSFADKMFVQSLGNMAGKNGLIYVARNAEAVSYFRRYGNNISLANLYRLAKSYLKHKYR